MTPSLNPLTIPFPGSPLSDPCVSPETSHTSSSGWDVELESEDLQFRCFAENTTPTIYTLSMNDPTYSRPTHPTEEEDSLTPLEMPDGSTRWTANWLPVDPGAGFMIDSNGKDYQRGMVNHADTGEL